MTEFGAELRVKSPEAILFHKHSEDVVVSDDFCLQVYKKKKRAADLYLLGLNTFSLGIYREKYVCFR